MPLTKTDAHRVSVNYLVYMVLVALMILLSFFQLVLANRLASLGREVSKIEEQAASLEEANLLLENQQSTLSSLGRVNRDSAKLGLSKSSSFVFITPQTPVAYKN